MKIFSRIFPPLISPLNDRQLIELLKFACKGRVVIINADISELPAPIDGCAKEYVVLKSL